MNTKKNLNLHNVLTMLFFFLPENIAFRNLEKMADLMKSEVLKSKYNKIISPDEISATEILAVIKDLGNNLVSCKTSKDRVLIRITPEFKAIVNGLILKASPTNVNRIKELSRILFRNADFSSNFILRKKAKESDRVLEVMNSLADKKGEVYSLINRLYGILKENGL
ncbi:MAG: hypothetical protein M0P12_00310 [Paludibacteraceae bacterium]|nr:hypothetical protein [Paludibacteraceae bacterium]MCK9615964.1 hypothetical protein [Candidatus Omnitrophota bacterium]